MLLKTSWRSKSRGERNWAGCEAQAGAVGKGPAAGRAVPGQLLEEHGSCAADLGRQAVAEGVAVGVLAGFRALQAAGARYFTSLSRSPAALQLVS